MFISLVITVHYNPLGLGWDQAILIALHQTHQPILDHWAKILTDLGIWIVTAPVLGLIALILTYQQQWQKGVYIAITVFGAIPLSYGLKHLFNRPRPHLWSSDVAWPTNPSFPSGHAFSSMMFVTLIILLWPWRGRTWVVLAGSLFVILIGWTRLYLGVHYPSDILAGWSIAIAWCVSVYLIYSPGQTIQKDE
ncbi:phosphatase PAP2 family protein [Synechocystis sp. LKSZ1]|uniref:phosphatase PAP2 family protein n=1 Tax=Synechocystis sp. LKSZ1 TaxID=3144951 RepID=UPI00336BF33B